MSVSQSLSSTLRLVLAFAAILCTCLSSPVADAAILITEVIPNVTTSTTRGDIVELYNTGPGPVNLTDWVLTDLDDDPAGGVPADPSFAPALIAIDDLQAGEFAVIEFVDVAGTTSWGSTN